MIFGEYNKTPIPLTVKARFAAKRLFPPMPGEYRLFAVATSIHHRDLVILNCEQRHLLCQTVVRRAVDWFRRTRGGGKVWYGIYVIPSGE